LSLVLAGAQTTPSGSKIDVLPRNKPRLRNQPLLWSDQCRAEIATALGKPGRSKFNYPTETAVNGIHQITAQPHST
jgi:hypothetical protein